MEESEVTHQENLNENKPATKRSPWRKRLVLFTIGLLLLLSIIGYFKYYYVYSEGTRVGILYKFSKKGAVYKTYEGEMMLPGIRSKNGQGAINSNIFRFSVADEELAKTLMNSQGMELELHYLNYNNSLPWRGDTYDEEDGQFIVDALVKIKNENPNGYGL